MVSCVHHKCQTRVGVSGTVNKTLQSINQCNIYPHFVVLKHICEIFCASGLYSHSMKYLSLFHCPHTLLQDFCSLGLNTVDQSNISPHFVVLKFFWEIFVLWISMQRFNAISISISLSLGDFCSLCLYRLSIKKSVPFLLYILYSENKAW